MRKIILGISALIPMIGTAALNAWTHHSRARCVGFNESVQWDFLGWTSLWTKGTHYHGKTLIHEVIDYPRETWRSAAYHWFNLDDIYYSTDLVEGEFYYWKYDLLGYQLYAYNHIVNCDLYNGWWDVGEPPILDQDRPKFSNNEEYSMDNYSVTIEDINQQGIHAVAPKFAQGPNFPQFGVHISSKANRPHLKYTAEDVAIEKAEADEFKKLGYVDCKDNCTDMGLSKTKAYWKSFDKQYVGLIHMNLESLKASKQYFLGEEYFGIPFVTEKDNIAFKFSGTKSISQNFYDANITNSYCSYSIEALDSVSIYLTKEDITYTTNNKVTAPVKAIGNPSHGFVYCTMWYGNKYGYGLCCSNNTFNNEFKLNVELLATKIDSVMTLEK